MQSFILKTRSFKNNCIYPSRTRQLYSHSTFLLLPQTNQIRSIFPHFFFIVITLPVLKSLIYVPNKKLWGNTGFASQQCKIFKRMFDLLLVICLAVISYQLFFQGQQFSPFSTPPNFCRLIAQNSLLSLWSYLLPTMISELYV